MAKKNYLKELPKLGGTAVMTMAVAAALAIPANATEVDPASAPAPDAPAPVSAPVSAPAPAADPAPTPPADPAPAASSSNVQEVSGHNATVSESNGAAVQENADTAAGNENTGSGNEATAKDNESVPSGNETIDGGNETVADSNEQIDNSNQQALGGGEAGNTEQSDTPELPEAPQKPTAPETPDLPEVPEVPDAPEVPELNETDPDDYNEGVEDYNEKVDDYNEGVDGYNQKVDDYNETVDDYNKDVEDYNEKVDDYNEEVKDYNEKVNDLNQELEDQYNADHEQWEQDKQDNQQAHTDYQTAKDNYDKAKKEYEDAVAKYKELYNQWTIEHQAWEDRKAAHLAENGTEEEYNQMVADYEKAKADWEAECGRLTTEYLQKLDGYNNYLDKLEKYEQYLKDQEQYETEKEIYDQLVTENEIYDAVVDYNEVVEKDNQGIQDLNDQLTSDLDTGAVSTLEEAQYNADVNAKLQQTEEGKALLATLGEENRKALADAEKALAERAAALDAEAKNNYTLGSEAYADYLERVKKFNADVEAHNANLAAYNDAVTKYNQHVDQFNEENKPTQGSSSTDNGYSEGDADWGNISITQTDKRGNTTNKTFDHIDVKYQAASSQTVTTDQDGKNPVYSENVSRYTVTGVYANDTTSNYSVSYDKNGAAAGGTGTQTLTKDSNNVEFGGPHGGRIGFDPLNGTVSFHVTLTDEHGKEYSIDVTLNDTTTYAEGSYYAAESSDLLKYYRDSDGNPLKTVEINEKTYFDISGQSVFVISALTCEGTKGNSNAINLSSMSGLDLVLNLQTMIKVHQAENAQKITYQGGYLLGKLAYAEAPADPGEEPTAPNVVEEPEEKKEPTLDLPGFTEQTFDGYNHFTDPEPVAPTPVDPNKNPGEFNEQKPDDFTDPEPQPVRLSTLDTLQKLKTMDELKTMDYLSNKLDYKMILVIPEVPREDPKPIVIPNGDPTPVVVREVDLKDNMVIEDENIPLAKAPKTGDLSGIWAVISGLSLGGISLLNRKRKEEE